MSEMPKAEVFQAAVPSIAEAPIETKRLLPPPFILAKRRRSPFRPLLDNRAVSQIDRQRLRQGRLHDGRAQGVGLRHRGSGARQ